MAIKGDFISFTYNGVHSTELGIVHVSASNRYTDALLPTIQDKTVQVAGSNGTYFFGSYYTQRQISLNIAYDEVSESQLRLARKVFGDQLSHPLIFDEEPYKIYYAKVTGTPQYTYIPFSTPRVYKGEGTLTFTCYEPFAHTLNSQKYLSQFPEVTEDKELSGSLVSFNDGTGNLKKLEVKFNLSQDFNGYSKPWSGGNGKNLYPDTLPSNTIIGTIDSNNNIATATNARIFAFPCESNTDYTFSANATPNGVGTIAFSNKLPEIGDTVDKRGNMTNRLVWTLNSGENSYILVNCGSVETYETSVSTYQMMVEKGSTATSYEPYENICPITGLTGLSVYVSPTQDQQDATEYTKDWTSVVGIVYGGTLDVATGVLTVDKVMADLGDSTWIVHSSGNVYTENFILDWIANRSAISSQYVHVADVSGVAMVTQNGTFALQSSAGGTRTRIIIKDDSFIEYTAEQVKSALTGVQVVYEPATPITYQLTPQEVSVLEGENNIWSNSGNVTVIYRKLIRGIEDWKLEWNPSANLLDEQGSYDSYDSITGFKLYNPGDMETDFKLIIPTSQSFVVDGIVASNSLTGESRILTTSITSVKEGDVSIQFNSKTNLIEGLNAQGARTGNIYNDCIVSGEWFKIPLTTDGNWYLQILDYSNVNETAPEIIYDYLYL